MKNGVHIIECLDHEDPGSEGRFLKELFKLMEIKSKFVRIKTIDELLSQIEHSNFKYIHISTHGSVSEEEQFKGWWTHDGIGKRAKIAELNGKLKCTAIVSTACNSGAEGFGRYVVDNLGSKYFIGPSKSPDFCNSVFFSHIFYHKLFKTKGSLGAAFRSYKESYKNPYKFKLFK